MSTATSALSYLCDRPADFDTDWPSTPRVYTGHDLHSLFPPSAAYDICADRSRWPLQISMVNKSRISGEQPVADHPTDTLVLNGLHLTWPSLNAFCRRLEGELGHPMTANVYATPPKEQGFGAHWDTHNVWIAQLEGRKTWRVSAPVVVDPLEHQSWKSVGFTDAERHHAIYEPDHTFDLRAGQVLWIPRGWVHWGSTGDENSMHVTIGAHLLTWDWALRQMVAAGAGDHSPFLRAALPPRLDIHNWVAWAESTREHGLDFLTHLVPEDYVVQMRSAQHHSFTPPLA